LLYQRRSVTIIGAVSIKNNFVVNVSTHTYLSTLCVHAEGHNLNTAIMH
jgi:hypothetical protein